MPTLTLSGVTLLARQGIASRRWRDVVELGGAGWKEYVAKAVEFSRSPERLQMLRRKLREQVRQSPLFDAERFATGFAQTLWALWRGLCLRKHRNKSKEGASSGEPSHRSVRMILYWISAAA